MVFGRGKNNDLADRPANDDAPSVVAFVPQPNASGINPERSWLYRTPGIAGDGKGRSGRVQNPWTAAPARPVEPPSPPVQQVVKPPMPPPVPMMIQAPPAFLNPAPSVAQPLYGHEPVPIRENPVVALTKAVLSTVVLCLGFWFATLLYVISLFCFFPYAFNAWEGNATALPGLGISCAIALLMALWIGNQTTWWWGVLTFFFLPIVFAVYVFKQNRGMVSRTTRRPVAKFPTMVTIGSMIGIGIFCLIVSILFLLHNYGDEISRGDPPFDRYSLDAHLIDEPAPYYSSF